MLAILLAEAACYRYRWSPRAHRLSACLGGQLKSGFDAWRTLGRLCITALVIQADVKLL